MNQNKWAGYSCYRLYHDFNGNLFKTGAKYVVFNRNILVGCFSTQTEADMAFKLLGPSGIGDCRKANYLGLDERLREG
jgi:hypothetical protein